MSYLDCPYLSGQVELTEEREQHIADSHPDLLPEHRNRIGYTLADPDQIRRSARLANALLFSRRFETIRGGKYIVVVVAVGATAGGRNWIVTAYLARKLAGGDLLWQRN